MVISGFLKLMQVAALAVVVLPAAVPAAPSFATGVSDAFSTPLMTANTVLGSFSGSVTDVAGDGLTVSPVNPFPQTTTPNGTQDAGVNVGHAFRVGPGVPGSSYFMPAAQRGPQPGPLGAWTSMELPTQFSLTDKDIATMNGHASIAPVPEPGTLLLLGGGLLGLAIWTRRRR